MATGKVSLKLLVDKSNRMVLFAEGGKDFVDFLFHVLVLPVGTVIQLLTKIGMVGSLGNLYRSVEKLNEVYIRSSKDILLNPKAPPFLSEIPFLLPETSSLDSTLKTYYRCSSRSSTYCGNYVAEDPSAKCPQCNCSMNHKLTLVQSPADKPMASAGSAAESDHKGGFVQGVVTYMVMDDLEVKPMSTISSITMLNQFNVKEVGHLEEKVVSLGMDEGIKLLRASLHSKHVLTDVFLGEKEK
ncbi:Dirigent protein [Psidium guajava]|nr:Dirigent protein [Psidium guajava]